MVTDQVRHSQAKFFATIRAGEALLLRYHHKQKASSWLRAVGLQLPEANTIKRLNSSVLTTKDVVNLEGERKMLWSRYPVPAEVSGTSGFVDQTPKPVSWPPR